MKKLEKANARPAVTLDPRALAATRGGLDAVSFKQTVIRDNTGHE
jgi:hypothetical protein